MKTIASFALAVALASTTTCAAWAQAVQRLTPNYIVVEHGKSIKIGNYSSVDPDCHVIGRTSINLLVAPQGGQVQTENGYDYPSFAQNNVRFVCNKRKLASTIVSYQAAPNFTGTDTFTLESVSTNGVASQVRFTVNVR